MARANTEISDERHWRVEESCLSQFSIISKSKKTGTIQGEI